MCKCECTRCGRSLLGWRRGLGFKDVFVGEHALGLQILQMICSPLAYHKLGVSPKQKMLYFRGRLNLDQNLRMCFVVFAFPRFARGH